MPVTKANMTVSNATTTVKAIAVNIVIRHRTIKLRMLYRSGTLPTAANSAKSSKYTMTIQTIHRKMPEIPNHVTISNDAANSAITDARPTDTANARPLKPAHLSRFVAASVV